MALDPDFRRMTDEGVGCWGALSEAPFPSPSLPIGVPTFVGMTGVRCLSERSPRFLDPINQSLNPSA
jgi:hypothetical protein